MINRQGPIWETDLTTAHISPYSRYVDLKHLYYVSGAGAAHKLLL